jgi:hypothetical protein
VVCHKWEECQCSNHIWDSRAILSNNVVTIAVATKVTEVQETKAQVDLLNNPNFLKDLRISRLWKKASVTKWSVTEFTQRSKDDMEISLLVN